ncbi:MAG TPA: DUF6458 family protein [Thermoleophilaceae bacterium]|nr:DUF6458 family protein [Thermoleophilaceae bacterium]
MSIGASIFLFATGAILRYAITAEVSGVDIATVGTILMVAGVIALLASLALAFAGPNNPRDDLRR